MTPRPSLDNAKGTGSWLRRTGRRGSVLLWVLLLIVATATLVLRERRGLLQLGHVLRTADIWWVAIAVTIEAAIVVLTVLKTQGLLSALGHRVGWRPLGSIFFRRQVIATAVPLGAPASLALFVRAVATYGVPPDDALYAALLFSLLGSASFVLLLVPVLVWLGLEREVSSLLLGGSLLLLALVAILAIALRWVLSGRRLPRRLKSQVADRIDVFTSRARARDLSARHLAATFILAIIVDLAGGVLLYASLRAVGAKSTLAVAFGGYAVGTVFLLVSPVFQGIGIVELSMAAALTGLGVPGGSAVAAALLYRFCELWLPFVVGLMLQSRGHHAVRRLSPHLPALVTGLTGLASILSVLAPTLPGRVNQIDRYWPLAVSDVSRTLTLVGGFFLLFLSLSLWRRKRFAWLAALLLLGVTVMTHLLKGHDQIIAVIALVNIGLLLAYRRRFRVRSDVPTIAKGFARLGLNLLLALGYGVTGFWLLDRSAFGTTFSVIESVDRTVRLFFGIGDPGLSPRTRYAAWFLDSFTVVGVISVAYAIFSLARPVVWRRRILPAERERARRLIELHGNSSLDFFKHGDDKLFFFAARGDGVVSYGLSNATAIVLGDPVAADRAAFRSLLAEFLTFCDANGWRAAFHQVSPYFLDDYRSAGLSALKIGEDAIVDLDRFTLQGGSMKSLRSTVNKFVRDGFQATVTPPPLPDTLLARLRDVSDEWLTLGGRRERAFTLGHWDDAYLRACPVMTIDETSGKVLAFVNLIPDGVPGEATIDLMRHRSAIPNGTMDYLFVQLFLFCQSQGYRAVSLGMVPFAPIGREPGSRPLERGIHLLSTHLNRFFSAQSLRAYKDKFHPIWEPRYLVYHSELSLPAVALAIVRLTEGREPSRRQRGFPP